MLTLNQRLCKHCNAWLQMEFYDVYFYFFLQSSSSENLPGGSGFIQPDRFTYLTLTIISGTLMMGILFPQGNHSACVSDISWTVNFALQMWTLGCNFVVSYSVYKDSAEVLLLVVYTNLLLLLPWKRSGEESGWWWFWFFFLCHSWICLGLDWSYYGDFDSICFPLLPVLTSCVREDKYKAYSKGRLLMQ